MKKELSFFLSLIAVIILVLSACSSEADSLGESSKIGIAPYELSGHEEDLLESFGLSSENSQILSFRAPEEAVSVVITVSILEDNGSWKNTGGGSISLGSSQSDQQLSGIFTMKAEDDHAIDLHINRAALYSFRTDPIVLDNESLSGSTLFLREFTEIELNEEIPVALLMYDSGTAITAYSLQSYFEPTVFEGIDLVQAITVRFADTDIDA